MKHKFQVNRKLNIIAIVFMLLFIVATSVLMNIILDSDVKLTANVHLNQVTSQLIKEINLLKITTEKISENNMIIDILDENRSFSDLSEEEKYIIIDQINLYEHNLKASRFVNNINLTSLSGEYLFSKGKICSDFKLNDRSWFNDGQLQEKNFITDIHIDFTSNKETISIVSFIYSKDKTELLGAVILDIFVEDLVKELEESFYLGKLKVIIDKYSSLEDIKKDKEYKDYYIRESQNVLSNGNMILFLYDKDSIKSGSVARPILNNTKLIILIIGMLIAINLIISIRLAFRPALKSIDKLKKLMGNLSEDKENISFDNMDEFKQLEIISMGIGKSFDNKIQKLIYYDTLTGVGNRKKLMISCRELIDRKEQFALIFIDLNKFKRVNDIYGHSAGDQILVIFSNIMKEVLGDSGELIRYSGDEFIIIYKDFQGEDKFIEFYKNEIVRRFKETIEISTESESKVKMSIEFSSGVALYPKDGVELEDLIDKSDFMMYASKKNNEPYKLSFFNESIYKEMLHIELLKSELKYAIQRKELYLNYQPIFDENKNIVKAEALIRWNNKVLGEIRPDNFIKYAEETREIIPIGYWIIESVCSFIRKNSIKVPIGINVSPIELLEKDFVDKVKTILARNNVKYNEIYFEITESVLLEDSEIVKNNILNLRNLGISIALDDFGTGYASFNYLGKYKMDILKLDKLFIDNASEKELEIIGCIKKISNLLNMVVVIEGIESEKQFNGLKRIGCKFFQGYYLSKPLNEEDFLKKLN